jgi:DNA-binding MarR family transcriptional regulator
MQSRDGCRVNDVSDILIITVGGASKLVDRIEAAGLCARRPNPGDRRSSLLVLTKAGVDLLGRAEVVVEDELRRRLAEVVSPAALTHFASTLAELRAATKTKEPNA